MEELLRNVSSPSWWVGVVIVGILINLISAYLKPRIDGIASKLSTRRRNQVAADQEFRKAAVERLKADPHEQLMAAAVELRHRLRALWSMLLGVLSFACYVAVRFPGMGLEPGAPRTAFSILFLGMFAVFFGFGSSEQESGRRTMRLLSEARGKERREA